MSSAALLSWRVVAEIAISAKKEWLEWLMDGQQTSSLLVSQFSLIKASSFIQNKMQAGPINPNGLLERFARQYLLPQNVVEARQISPCLYNALASKHGKDDLELLTVCLALQNHYEYLCWTKKEKDAAARLHPKLIAKVFEPFADGL